MIRFYPDFQFIKNYLENHVYVKIVNRIGGNMLSQMILVLSFPLLARIYEPEAFGQFGVYFSWMSIFSIISTFGYSSLIPAKHAECEALALFNISNYASLLNIFIFSAVFLVWKPMQLFFLGDYMYLLAINIGIAGIYNAQVSWLVRQQLFKALNRFQVIRSVFVVVFQYLLGMIGTGPLGLVIGLQAGTFIFCIMVWYSENGICQLDVSARRMLIYAKKDFRQPLFMMPAQLCNTLSSQLPILLLSLYYGDVAAGYFFMAQRIFIIPMNLICASASQVFYSFAAKAYALQKNCTRLFNEISLFVISIFVVLIPGIWILGDALVTVLGNEWEPAINLLRIIVPFSLPMCIYNPVSPVFFVTNKQKIFLILQLIYLIVVYIAISATNYFACHWTVSVWAYAVSASLFYSAVLLYCRHLSMGLKDECD